MNYELITQLHTSKNCIGDQGLQGFQGQKGYRGFAGMPGKFSYLFIHNKN